MFWSEGCFFQSLVLSIAAPLGSRLLLALSNADPFLSIAAPVCVLLFFQMLLLSIAVPFDGCYSSLLLLCMFSLGNHGDSGGAYHATAERERKGTHT
jgi:hypothetical protein